MFEKDLTFRIKFNSVFPKKRYAFQILFLIIIGLASKIEGQTNVRIQNRIDSLENEYRQETNDTLRLSYLTHIARNYRFINLDTSKYLLKKVIQLHKSKKVNPRIHAFAYNVIGDIYRLEQKIDSAKYYYEEAYHFFSKIIDIDYFPIIAIAPAYGRLLVKNNEVRQGIQILQEAIQIAEEKRDIDNLCYLYASLGNVMLEPQKDYNKAKSIFLKGLDASQHTDEINFKRVGSTFNLGLAKIFLIEGKIDSTIRHAERAVIQATACDYFQKSVIAQNILCESYLIINQIKKANSANQNAIKLFAKVKDLSAISKTKILKLKLYSHSKENDKCIRLGNQLLQDYYQNLDSEMKKDLYNILFDSYLLSKNYAKALTVKDSLLYYTQQNYSEENSALIAKLYDETLVQEEKAKNRVLLIQQEEANKRLSIQKIAGIGLFVALLFALAWALTAYRLYNQKNKQSHLLEALVAARTKELQKVNDDLRQANFEITSLSNIASHDIKEPMRNIGNFIGFIKLKLPSEIQEKLNEEFSFIDKSVKQLYTLIEDYTKYIGFSKKDDLTLGNTDIKEVINDIDAELKIKYTNYLIQPVGVHSFITNRSAIYFILKNLIDNALKFNKSDKPSVSITQEENQNEVMLFVKDNGIGISPQYKDKIFENYKRLHNRGEYQGSGLGLSIVKILTKKLNGKIELESQPGRGSLFILSFPKFTK